MARTLDDVIADLEEEIGEDLGTLANPGEARAVANPVMSLLSGANQEIAGTVDLLNQANPGAVLPGLLQQMGVPVQRPMTAQEIFQSIGATPTASPFAETMGRNLGGGTLGLLGGGAAAARAAVPRTVDGLQSLLTQIGEPFLNRPARTAAGEMVASTAAGLGQATAQESGVGPGGQALAQAAPAALATSATGAARFVLRGPRVAAQRALDIFDTAGVPPTLGQVTRNPAVSFVQIALGRTPGTTRIISDAMDRQANAIGERLSQQAASLSARPSKFKAGKRIKEGIKASIARSQLRAGGLWSKADAFIPLDTQLRREDLSGTVDVIAELGGETGPLSRLFIDSRVGALKSVLPAPTPRVDPDLAQVGPEFRQAVEAAVSAPEQALTFENLKRARSVIGQKASVPELISGIPQSDLKRLYRALTDDMKEMYRQAGGLDEFNRANNFTRELHDRVEDVLDGIVKKTTPEEVYRAAIGDNATKVRTVRKSLTKEQWKVVQAAVIDRLGKGGDIGEVAGDRLFRMDTFMNQFRAMPMEVRKALFTGPGSEGLEAALNQHIRVVNKARDTPKVGTLLAQFLFLGGATIGLGGPEAGVVGAIVTSQVLARAFTSPKFVRWTTQMTQLSRDRLPGHIARLSSTISDLEPDIQAEILSAMQKAAAAFDLEAEAAPTIAPGERG